MKRRSLTVLAVLTAFALLGPYVIPLPAQPDRRPEDLAPPDGRFLTVGGVQTFVQESGPPGGPAVVLIHGFGGSTFNWRYTLPALGQAGYRAAALDLKGFGLADKTFETDYTHAAQAEFVAEAMTALGIQEAVLVGHSLGGSVIAHLALRYPERVRGLVFAAAAVNTDPDAGGPGLRSLAGFAPFRRWGQILLRLLLGPDRVTAMLRSAYANPAFATPEVIEGALRPQQARDWDLALLGILRDSRQNALTQPLPALAAPSLIVWGEEDSWVPLERGQELRAALPQAEWVVIPRAGHLLMEEQAEAFNTALLDFLR